jgi:hypothetical protein
MEFLKLHFDCTVEYKSGKLNPADPLSRLEINQVEIHSVSVTKVLPIIENLFEEGYQADETFGTWRPVHATRDESF